MAVNISESSSTVPDAATDSLAQVVVQLAGHHARGDRRGKGRRGREGERGGG